jgi:hypothetical protein
MQTTHRSSLVMNTFKNEFLNTILFLALIFGIGISFSGVAFAGDPSKEEQQTDIRKMADETLARLYKEQPSAKKTDQSSCRLWGFQ